MTGPRLSGPALHADDTRRRFLVEVLARVPLERIVEVHLFTPIRQGGSETGAAVVVALREVPAATVPAATVPAATVPAPNDVDDTANSLGTDEPAVAPSDDDAIACDPTDDAAGPVTDDAFVVAEPVVEDTPPRHTVFAARYRLVLRGPDRGRWIADVVEEADAPLITVGAVVRGVQRRAGDEDAPERLDADDVAATVGVSRTP